MAQRFRFSRASDPAAPTRNHDPEQSKALMGRFTFERAVTCSQSDRYKERQLRREMWRHLMGEVR